jgi:hypothetical protein
MVLELKIDLLMRQSLDQTKLLRACEWSKCCNKGTHRAPKSRNELNSFLWFCKNHARDYNKSWNYYDGMSDCDVEADIRNDTVWQRPTWRLGTNGSENLETMVNFDSIHDRFDVLYNSRPKINSHSANETIYNSEQIHALAIFGLERPGDTESIKQRYKKLVKQYHPDTKGLEENSDEKIKDVNQAYKILIDYTTS